MLTADYAEPYLDNIICEIIFEIGTITVAVVYA